MEGPDRWVIVVNFLRRSKVDIGDDGLRVNLAWALVFAMSIG